MPSVTRLEQPPNDDGSFGPYLVEIAIEADGSVRVEESGKPPPCPSFTLTGAAADELAKALRENIPLPG